MRLRSVVLGAPLVFALLSAGAPAVAQEIQDRIIRVGHPQTTDHPISLGVKRFAEIVAAKSGGKLKVREFPTSQLGSETQQRSALQGGVQEIAVQGPAIAGVVKEFGMLDFPFIVSTTKQADALLDGPFGTALQAKLPEKGLVGLGMWEVGFRHVTNSKRPVSRLEDMEGLKIRVQPTPVFVETFKALKTNPVPLAFSELYAALETKAVDAQENPYQNIRSTKLYEVQKHVTNTSHVYGMVYVVASKMFWDKLSPTERKILQDAAIEARDFQRQTSRAQAEQAIAALKASGMVFTDMSDAERDRMRQATKPVTDKVLTEYDPTLVKLFQSELDRVHKLR